MSEAKQSGRSPGWRKGQSGNPSGRKKGGRNKSTLLAIALMENELNDIVRTIIDAAKGGDMAAARLIVDQEQADCRPDEIRFRGGNRYACTGYRARA